MLYRLTLISPLLLLLELHFVSNHAQAIKLQFIIPLAKEHIYNAETAATPLHTLLSLTV